MVTILLDLELPSTVSKIHHILGFYTKCCHFYLSQEPVSLGAFSGEQIIMVYRATLCNT
jgi:hypothetical protein